MVLCGITHCFQRLSPIKGQVAHVFLTRPPRKSTEVNPVRLACIRHAASVDPEPGSNSPPNISLHSLNPREQIQSGCSCFTRPPISIPEYRGPSRVSRSPYFRTQNAHRLCFVFRTQSPLCASLLRSPARPRRHTTTPPKGAGKCYHDLLPGRCPVALTNRIRTSASSFNLCPLSEQRT